MREVQLLAAATTRSPLVAPIGRRALRAAAAATLVLSFGILASAPAAGDVADISVVRNWRPFTADPVVNTAVLALDTAGRTAYAFSQPGHVAPLSVSAWNLDTLKRQSPQLKGPDIAPITARTPIGVDEKRHVVVLAPSTATLSLTSAPAAPTVTVLGLRDGQVKVFGTPTTRFQAGYQIAGIGIDAAHDRALVLAMPDTGSRSVLGPGTGVVQLDAWRLSDLARGVVTPDLTTPPAAIPSTCAQVLAINLAAGVIPSADGRFVYFGCVGTTGGVGRTDGEVAGVAKYELFPATAGTSSFRLYPMAGDFNRGDALAAPGSTRLVLASAGNEANFKVFDTRNDHYVGNVGVESLNGMTSNPVTGRGYMLVGSSLGVFDLDQTPVTQGVLIPTDLVSVGSTRRIMVFDPKTRRLFVPTSSNVSTGDDPYVVVLRDTNPGFGASGQFNPDDGALDVPEVPGRTDSIRVSGAQAIGADHKLIGGVSDLLLNARVPDTRGQIRPGTRRIAFAVADARLTNDETAGHVTTMQVDGATASDAQYTPPVTQTCTDYGDAPDTKTDDNASAACDLAKQHVEATVSASLPRIFTASGDSATPLPAAVQVRSATAHIVTERLSSGVTKTTVTSEAEGIDILGVVQIGQVTATAVTETHGRSKTAQATYTPTVSDVVVAGTKVCGAVCSLPTVRDRINDALAGRAMVTNPAPDLLASRGGSAAWVKVNEFQHAEDTLFADEAFDVVVTPALQVVVYADGIYPSEQITRLALVGVNQSYRIYAPPPDGGGIVPPTVTGSTPPTTIRVPGTTTSGSNNTGGGGGPTTTANPGTRTDGGLLGALVHGLRVVFRSPRQVTGIALVWLLLALPVYLAARRRLLLELPRLRRVQEDV